MSETVDTLQLFGTFMALIWAIMKAHVAIVEDGRHMRAVLMAAALYTGFGASVRMAAWYDVLSQGEARTVNGFAFMVPIAYVAYR